MYGYGYKLIKTLGDKKQENVVYNTGGSPNHCDDGDPSPAESCAGGWCDNNGFASESPCLTCSDPEITPCVCFDTVGGYVCHFNYSMAYYEWECP